MNKAFLNWSSGKDALMALLEVEEKNDLSVETLLTTYNSDSDRVSMHGLSLELLEKQTEALGLPLKKIALSGTTPMQEYNEIMQKATSELKEQGFTHSIFGDIFLEDLKAYREEEAQKAGMEVVFPLWQKNTKNLIKNFIELGYKAVVVCIDAQKLNSSFCGREIDFDFLNDLPQNVDPCGENGEFHTFVYDGPRFSNPVQFKKGEQVLRDFSPSTSEGDSCFTDEKDWSQKFYYQELIWF